MSLFSDLLGSTLNIFQIGDRTSGTKTLRFNNGSLCDLQAAPTANRVLVLPDASGTIAIAQQAVLFSHFLAGTGEFIAAVSGTGASISTTAMSDPGGRPGIAQLNSGTTAAPNRAWLGTFAAAIAFGYGKCAFETLHKIDALSNSTDTYTLRLGFQNNTSAESSNAVFFRYTSGGTGNWQIATRVNNTETATDTGIATDLNWHKFRVEINSAASSANFYIDGSSVGAIASNIPTGASQSLGAACSVIKSAGTTARTFNADYIYVGANIG